MLYLWPFRQDQTTYVLPHIVLYIYAHIYADTHIYMHARRVYSYL